MRRLILPAIILLSAATALCSLSACNPWQYMTVESPQLPRNRFNQFVYENDTLRLIYDMAGNNGEVSLRIFNKTTEPLYINWQKSAFIRNQQSVSFYADQVIIIHGHSISRAAWNAHQSNFTGTFTPPESVGFIAPGTEIERTLPNLASTGPLQIDPLDSLPVKKLAQPNGVADVKYKQLHYDEANTPIRFKSYLTFAIGKENKEFSATNLFYVGDIYVADGRPETFSLYHGHGDQIYIHQKQNAAYAPPTGNPTASSNIR